MAENISRDKRRKVASLCITDLSDNLLTHVATYLTSRPSSPAPALLAAALTAPSSGHNCTLNEQRSNTRKAIISLGKKEDDSSPYIRYTTVLDFAQLDKSLASRLTDDDLHSVLVCIDASNKLNKLKLTGCTNIKGHGLELLRGSSVLEQIDLSLVGQHENPTLNPAPKICEKVVLPILWSIVNKDEASLQQLQLPKKWTAKRSKALKEFLVGYTQYLRSRPFCWCAGAPEREWIDAGGAQRHTCYDCLETICDDPDHDFHVNCCSTCKKYYCSQCIEVKVCEKCGKGGCGECMSFEDEDLCENCEVYYCDSCVETCEECKDMPCCSYRDCESYRFCRQCVVNEQRISRLEQLMEEMSDVLRN